MNLLGRAVLFISSYAPLGAMFFLTYIGTNNWIAFISLGVGVGSTTALWLLTKWWERDSEPVPDKVLECRQPGTEVMGYIVAYLLPFLDFSLSSWRHIFVLAVYILILGYLYVTTDMIRINPTLNVMLRYRVYEVTLEENGPMWVITRNKVNQGGKVLLVSVGKELAIGKAGDDVR